MSSFSRVARASSPDEAVRTSYPRGVRIAWRSRTFGGWSSTTSTRAFPVVVSLMERLRA